MTEQQIKTQFTLFGWAVFLFLIAAVVMQSVELRTRSELASSYRAEAMRYATKANEAVQLNERALLVAETMSEQVANLRREVMRERMIQRVLLVNRNKTYGQAVRIVNAVIRSSERYNVQPQLVLAVVEQESHYNDRAVGPKGERGLMQLTFRTASTLGVPWPKAFYVDDNIDAGVRYLATHLGTYGNVRRALVRYNGGTEYPALVLARLI